MKLSIVLVIRFETEKYSNPAQAEMVIQNKLLSGDLSLDDIRYDKQTTTFRTLIDAEQTD